MITVRLFDKEYDLPQSWNEVSLGDYQKIYKLEADSYSSQPFYLLDIISVLTGINTDLLLQCGDTGIATLIDTLKWLNNTEIGGAFIKTFEMDGVKYGYHPNLEKLNLGEAISLELEVSNQDDGYENMHRILAILIRPVDDTGKLLPFSPDDYLQRAEMYQNELKMTHVYKGINFFLLSVLGSLNNTHLSMQVLEKNQKLQKKLKLLIEVSKN